MREILFRGKTIDSPRWVEGYYAFDGMHLIERKSIECPRYWEVNPINPNTLGQFTGLYDKNGVRVFEGDIVHHINELVCEDMGQVYWDEKRCQFARTTRGPYRVSFELSPYATYEVIGNIFDNPELLEEVK